MRRYGSIVVQRRRCFILLYSICEKKMLFAGGINKCINFTIIQCRSARAACDRIMYSILLEIGKDIKNINSLLR